MQHVLLILKDNNRMRDHLHPLQYRSEETCMPVWVKAPLNFNLCIRKHTADTWRENPFIPFQ